MIQPGTCWKSPTAISGQRAERSWTTVEPRPTGFVHHGSGSVDLTVPYCGWAESRSRRAADPDQVIGRRGVPLEIPAWEAELGVALFTVLPLGSPGRCGPESERQSQRLSPSQVRYTISSR